MALGKLGRRGGFGSLGVLGSAGGLGYTQLALANRIYQRDTTSGGAGKGTGTVPVTIRPVSTGNVYARLRSAADGVTITQAQWTAGTVASTTSQTLNVTGVNAQLGWHYLDLSQDGVVWKLGTTPIGVGILVATAGQSLMQRMFIRPTGGSEDTTTISGAGVTINDNGRIFCVPGGANIPTSWRQSADATADLNSAGAPELCAKLIAAAGVNVGIVGVNQGGTATSVWVTGQALNTALRNTLIAAGGKFEAVWWFQGHSDAQNPPGYFVEQSRLTDIFTAFSDNNTFASPVKMITSIPYQGAATRTGSGWGNNYQQEQVRLAYHDWAVASGVTNLMFADQETTTDYTHQMQAGAKRMAWHPYRALRPHLGLSHDNAGATLGTPTKSGVNLTIPFTLPTGATGLALGGAGDGSKAFKVHKGGDRFNELAFDAVTPFAVDNTAKTITLKLAADPGAVPLSILPFGPIRAQTQTAYTDVLYDDITDGDGITIGRPLLFTPNPLKIVTARDLTAGGTPAYAAGKFSNGMTGGYATLAASPMPGLGTGFTFECWAKVITPDAVNTQAIFGSVDGLYVSVLGNTLNVKLDTSTARTYANALPTGSLVHIAVTNDGSLSCATWINGVKSGTVPGFFSVGTFVAGNPWAIRRRGDQTDNDAGTGLLVDEVAIFDRVKYSTTFTPPVSAYVGNEAGLVALYHLDSDVLNSAT